MSAKRTWTKENERLLIENYKKPIKELLILFPNKTKIAITAKINRLNLKRKNVWTEKEIKKLYKLYPIKLNKDLEKEFERTIKAIVAKANELNISKVINTKQITNWSKEEDEILKNYYYAYSKQEILEKLNKRNWTQIVKRANKIKLKRIKWGKDINSKELYNAYFVERKSVRECEKIFAISNLGITKRLKVLFPNEIETRIETSGRKYTKQYTLNKLESLDLEVTNSNDIYDFMGSNNKFTVKCKNNHESFQTNLNRLNKGNGCRKCYFENNKGENNPSYNKEITEEERVYRRNLPEYKLFRKTVFKRDSFKCQCCGDNKGGNLIAHHLESYHSNKSLRTNIDNGITLCNKCHKNFHKIYGLKNNTKEQFETFLKS